MNLKFILTLTAVLAIVLITSAQDFTSEFKEGGIGTFACADFNGDGKQDLVGIDYMFEGPAELKLMMNTSADTISFEEILLASSELFNGSPAVGDFDGDEDLDIAISFSDAKNIVLLRNNGDNTFLQENLGIAGVNILEFVDLEGDGDMDLAGYTFNEENIVTFINDGTGNLLEFKSFEHQNDISDVDYGDLDDDGDVDIVLSVDKFSGETVSIYLNDSLNNFEKFTSADINALNSAVQIEIIDFNKDGMKDIIGLNDKKLTAFIQTDIFGFVPQDLIEPNNIGDFSRFELADFNGDGAWDVVIGDFTDEMYWYENKALTFTQRSVSGQRPISNLLAEDFDGDGDTDFVAYNGDIFIYTNEIDQMPSSLKEIENNELIAYPNPTTGFITLNTENPGRLEVFNLAGKRVHLSTVQAGGQRVNLSSLESGIYQLRNIDLKTKKTSISKITKL